jgi:uncharacterized protein YgbK (DUF1537 family)
MTRYGIIADDLTGATDAAVPFAQAGFRTIVVLDPKQLSKVNADVIAITTYSRHDPPSLARKKVKAACDLLHSLGCKLLYKKMDSTVQGNIVAEAEAARDVMGFRTVLVCPANPSQGRRIRKGILFVKGRRFADLRKLVESQGLRDYGVIESPVTPRKVAQAHQGERPFVLADAPSNGELATLVKTVRGWSKPVLLAG